MKGSYIKDLANHGGPELCALVSRKGAAKR
jgi:hypothetical protein